MEERNTNFYINDGLIMQGKQIDTSVAVKIALDHGWSSIKGEHIFMETLVSPVDYTPLTNSGLMEYRGKFNAFKQYAEKYNLHWGFVRDIDDELYINNTEFVDDMSDDRWRPLSEEL